VVERNGNGRAWLDKWMWEIIRLNVVAIIALGGAYWAIVTHASSNNNRVAAEHSHIFDALRAQCKAEARTSANQATVLLVELSIVDILRDRYKVGLRRIPDNLRHEILTALARLPDDQNC